MIPEALWWVAGLLTFVGTVLFTAGSAVGKEWPGKLYHFVGMMVAAWGIAIAAVSGVLELVAWWWS